MATEKQLQEGIQAVFQGITDWFSPEDVTINDWVVLDWAFSRAPFAIIINNDDFESLMDTPETQDRSTVKVWILVALGARTWKVAFDEMRDVRQAVLDAFNTVGTARSGGGLEGVNIRRLFSLSEIGYVYPQGQDPELNPDATPDYITQMIGFETEQF